MLTEGSRKNNTKADTKILFCSSGKTYGHFLKTHALYLAAKSDYQCTEIVNPTKFVLPFRSADQQVEAELYFANDSFPSYKELAKNISKLVKMLKRYQPDIVVGDKLPNLMTACFKLEIPYISLSHATQLTHNWQNKDNPNLILFDRYWSENSLAKPVKDDSWFFYRSWGNLIVFADAPISGTEKLANRGYQFQFIGHIPLDIGDNQNHEEKIQELLSRNNAHSVVLITFSSYASKKTDRLLMKLAETFPKVVFVYPRENTAHLLNPIRRRGLTNIYHPQFIDYGIVKPLAGLIICLPGNATLNALRDYNKEILAFYMHREQKNNAMSYVHNNFSYYKLDKRAFEICATSIKKAPRLPRTSDAISTKKNDTRTQDLREKFRRIVPEVISAKE
jgi:hypothetical protein